MSIQKLERVLWRLRSLKPENRKTYTNKELRQAIMHECGTDPNTYYRNRDALKHLGWIKPHRAHKIDLTGKDIT